MVIVIHANIETGQMGVIVEGAPSPQHVLTALSDAGQQLTNQLQQQQVPVTPPTEHNGAPVAEAGPPPRRRIPPRIYLPGNPGFNGLPPRG